MYRATLAEFWHRRALLRREQILSVFDETLRPTAMPAQVNTSVPGMVGADYAYGGLVIVSVNPAGGRDGFEPTSGDAKLYEAAEWLRASDDVSVFEALNEAFVAGMPSWGPQWRVVRSILEAATQRLTQIAYPYLVPFRTRGDQGSKLPEPVLEAGYENGFSDMLAALRPGYLVPVDRPSERACLRFINDHGSDSKVIYLTRKRDAHAERAATLQRLSSVIR